MTRITFEQCRAYGVKYIMVDGKKRRRQKMFWKSVNPWNKNADGSVKTRAEVQAEVDREAREWESQP